MEWNGRTTVPRGVMSGSVDGLNMILQHVQEYVDAADRHVPPPAPGAAAHDASPEEELEGIELALIPVVGAGGLTALQAGTGGSSGPAASFVARSSLD